MITIDFTYKAVTPESAEHGDFAEAGFILPSGNWRIPVDLYTRQQWRVGDLSWFIRSAQRFGCTYWNGSWFESVDPDEDYQTGEDTYYAMHIEGATPSTLDRIIKYLEVHK